jgi:hypothetical protein
MRIITCYLTRANYHDYYSTIKNKSQLPFCTKKEVDFERMLPGGGAGFENALA